MANRKIKGITIEIGGDTTELKKALKDIDNESKVISASLKDVERLLKFDPRNTELLAEKQSLLSKNIDNTKERLEALRKAQEQNIQAFKDGKISEEAFNNLKREVIATEQKLKGYEDTLKDIAEETKAFEHENEKLEKLLDAVGGEIKDFESVLGTKLTKALENGTANSKDLKKAFEKIGKSAISGESDIDKLSAAINGIDKGNTDQLVNALKNVSKQAGKADNSIGGLKSNLEKIKNLEAFQGLKEGFDSISDGASELGGHIEGALDRNSSRIKLKVGFDLEGEELDKAQETLNNLAALDIDDGEAFEAYRRQLALNKDATTEQNQELIKLAGSMTKLYSGIDLTELVQENHEISKTLNISNEESLALVNSLLKVGFPPEQLDTVSEYATQLQRSGYNAQEVQAIFAAGVDTGTWNIDNLLDGIKEGRVKMAEFGDEISPTLDELLTKASISKDEFQALGRDIAEGGDKGKAAYEKVAKMLTNVKDETTKNALGVEIYGTKFEDQGTKITDTILGMNDHLGTSEESLKRLAEQSEEINDDPAVKLKEATEDLFIELTPLIEVLADVIGSLADWIKDNPKLASTIGLVVTALVPLVKMVGGAAQGIQAITSASGALKGLNLGGGAGAGTTAGAGAFTLGTDAGATTGAVGGATSVGGLALIAGEAYLGYKYWESLDEEMEAMQVEESNAMARAAEAYELQMKTSVEMTKRMKKNYKEIREDTNITFEELFNAINGNTTKATEAGAKNAGELKTKSLEEYRKILEDAGYDFDEIKRHIEFTTSDAKKVAEGNFEELWSGSKHWYDELLKDTETVFMEVDGKIIAYSASAAQEGKTNFENLKTNAANFFNKIKEKAEEKMPATAEIIKTAFGALPDELTKGPFAGISASAEAFLSGLQRQFDEWKPILPEFNDYDIHTNYTSPRKGHSGGGHQTRSTSNKLNNISVFEDTPLNPFRKDNIMFRKDDIQGFDTGGLFEDEAIIRVAEKRPEFVGALEDLKEIFRSVINETTIHNSKVENNITNNNNNTQEIKNNFNIQASIKKEDDIKKLSQDIEKKQRQARRARGNVWS